MKNLKYTFLLLLGLSSEHIFSQEVKEPSKAEATTSRDAKRVVLFGFKAGLNRSNVYDEQGQDFVANPKTGFVGGGFVAIPIGGFLGIQPEVLLSQKGFSSSGRIINQPYWLERTSTYIDVPLQLQLKPLRFLFLLAGVQYSYLLSQRDKFTDGVNSSEQKQEFANDNIRKNTFGGVVGFDVNIQHLVLSGRSAWDLRANRGDGSSYTPRYKNVWIQATIGYRIY